MQTWRFRPDPRRPEATLTRFQSWLHHVASVRRFRFVNACAARRSGKTAGLRLLVWDAALDQRPGDVGYMAPTRGQAKRLLWRPLMQDLMDPAARALVREVDKSELAIDFVSGTRLYLYSADAYERVRGDGFKRFLTDESDDKRFAPEVFDEAIGPALSRDRGQLIQSGTPKGRGRFFREWQRGDPKNPRKDPDYISCQIRAVDAELIHPDEIDLARRVRPPRAFRQEYEASFETAGVYIYDEFRHSEHVVRTWQLPRRFDDVLVGVDWGEAKRGVMLVVGVVHPRRDEDGDTIDDLPTLYVLEEHSHERMPYTSDGWWKIARKIQDDWAPSVWYCDPAQTIEEYRDKLGHVLGKWTRENSGRRPPRVVGADNAVKPGISTVQEFLHWSGDRSSPASYEPPHLLVREDGPHPCDNLIRTLPKYEWKRARGSNENDEREESPVKSDDHEADAIRYVCASAFGHIRGTARGRRESGGGW